MTHQQRHAKINLLLLVGVSLSTLVFAQSDYKQNTVSFLPALSYAQETGIRYGANFIIFKNLSGADSTSRMSKFLISAFGTTKDQYFTSNTWQIFTNKERWLSNGSFQTGFWSDRLYDAPTDITKTLIEIPGGGNSTIKPIYTDFDYTYSNINFTIEHKIAPHIYVGMSYEFDYTKDTRYTNDDSALVPLTAQLQNNNSRRSGLGAVITLDNRDNPDNPLHGSFIQINTGFYRKNLGGTVNYDVITLEANKYIPIVNKQILALRIVNEYRNPETGYAIPLRGLSYNGGITSLRGYYAGTFRANNLLAFESEYRLPFYTEVNSHSNIWKFWKRMGSVAFLSAVKTSDTYNQLFNGNTKWYFAGGVGVRYMLDTKQRVNLCLDYAVGFTKLAGESKNNSGLYIGISEAF